MANERYLADQVRNDLGRKMVFVSGPRQCGKTTLALRLLGSAKNHYFNWDRAEDRERILKYRWPTGKGLFVFDEIHKYARWRGLLKGLFDTERDRLQILVTGSAKLDHYRRGGDSLQGRYHLLRMHPLSFAELRGGATTLEALMKLGPFPEPYFSGRETFARRWSREYRTLLIREELTSLERVSEVSLMEHLALRLPELVGSPLSINGLREDLQVAHQTAARWLELLERLYAIFRVTPFGTPKIRAVKKEAKHYHFDWTQVAEPGPRFENLMAMHLLKWCHWIEDTEGFDMELRYFRDTDKREVDFVVMKDRKPIHFIECKYKAAPIDLSLKYLHAKFPLVRATQVHLQGTDDFETNGIRVMPAASLLAELV